MPPVNNSIDAAPFDGGLDLVSPPGQAKPGTARFATNYEAEFSGGGYRRVGGFERYDGRPSPSAAGYVALYASGGWGAGATVGATATGVTSGATGKIIYKLDTMLVVTRVVGTFVNEVINVSASPVGTVTETPPTITGFQDNEFAELAANEYRTSILKPNGTDKVRGLAILDGVLYCWRDVGANLVTYKATAGGWVVVPLASQVTFSAGTTVYPEGSTLTQGGASATVRRVVLESGSWAAGTAAGRMVISPIAGTFAAGAAVGSGACTLAGAAAAITQLAGGSVKSVVYNFTGTSLTTRLYCCDGINQEWEFDGTYVVPINTGMGSIRASEVAAHQKILAYAYRESLQYSAVGLPYAWSAVLGAGEIAVGDTITNLTVVSGSEANGTLLVLCKNSAWALYGATGAFKFVQVSQEAGAQRGTAQEIASAVVAFDLDGFTRYQPTQSFGNFAYESSSRSITPLVKNAVAMCSVLVKNKALYRCFFNDGLFISGTLTGNGFAWMPCDYGRVIHCAVGGEIGGRYRVFYGDADGWVLEADVGRSFDGAEVFAALRMSSQNQRSPLTEKQFRHAELNIEAESAFTISVAGEFDDSDATEASATTTNMSSGIRRVYGSGLFYDFNSWDRAYWDVALTNRLRFAIHGKGRSISLLVQSVSTNEAPHTLKMSQVIYTPRRLVR